LLSQQLQQLSVVLIQQLETQQVQQQPPPAEFVLLGLVRPAINILQRKEYLDGSLPFSV